MPEKWKLFILVFVMGVVITYIIGVPVGGAMFGISLGAATGSLFWD